MAAALCKKMFTTQICGAPVGVRPLQPPPKFHSPFVPRIDMTDDYDHGIPTVSHGFRRIPEEDSYVGDESAYSPTRGGSPASSNNSNSSSKGRQSYSLTPATSIASSPVHSTSDVNAISSAEFASLKAQLARALSDVDTRDKLIHRNEQLIEEQRESVRELRTIVDSQKRSLALEPEQVVRIVAIPRDQYTAQEAHKVEQWLTDRFQAYECLDKQQALMKGLEEDKDYLGAELHDMRQSNHDLAARLECQKSSRAKAEGELADAKATIQQLKDEVKELRARFTPKPSRRMDAATRWPALTVPAPPTTTIASVVTSSRDPHLDAVRGPSGRPAHPNKLKRLSAPPPALYDSMPDPRVVSPLERMARPGGYALEDVRISSVRTGYGSLVEENNTGVQQSSSADLYSEPLVASTKDRRTLPIRSALKKKVTWE